MSLSFMSHSVLCSWTKTVANKAPVDARPLQIRHGLGMWLAEGSLDMQSGARVRLLGIVACEVRLVGIVACEVR